MNERIQKLSDIADSYARSDNSSMLFENYKDRYTSKLSELIIQEYSYDIMDVHGAKPEYIKFVANLWGIDI